jgi:hypothetical protein
MEDCAAILRVGGEAMQPDQRFWAGKRVCATGGTGFLGWHLVRELLPRAADVRILGLPARSPYLRRTDPNGPCKPRPSRHVHVPGGTVHNG